MLPPGRAGQPFQMDMLNQSLPNFCVECLKTGNFGSKPGMKVGLSRMLVNPSETRVDSTSVCGEWRVYFGGPVCCELLFFELSGAVSASAAFLSSCGTMFFLRHVYAVETHWLWLQSE